MQNEVQVYYVRPQVAGSDGKLVDRKGAPPIATVAIMNVDGVTARGVAICSQGEGDHQGDNWCRAAGRARALARCRKAYGTQSSALPIGKPVKLEDGLESMRWSGAVFLDTWAARYGTGCLPQCKSEFNPGLTEFEQHVIKKAGERGTPKAAQPAGV